jgi:hypothetical protein
MTSFRQIEANGLNALKSTGPGLRMSDRHRRWPDYRCRAWLIGDHVARLSPVPDTPSPPGRAACSASPLTGCACRSRPVQQPRQMRSLSLMSSRDRTAALSSSGRAADGRSESRGWRCPTGACIGVERESGDRGVIPALSRAASCANAPHADSATARTAAAAMTSFVRGLAGQMPSNALKKCSSTQGQAPSSLGIEY